MVDKIEETPILGFAESASKTADATSDLVEARFNEVSVWIKEKWNNVFGKEEEK